MIHFSNIGMNDMNFSISRVVLKSFFGAAVALVSVSPMTWAQTAELDEFCSRYPENSRCENYEVSNPDPGESIDLSDSQLIQVQLNSTGSNDGFIWISLQRDEVNQTTELTAYHSVRLDSTLDQILGGALGATSPIPIPIDIFQLYDFREQRTEYLSFTPESCQSEPQIANGRGFEEADCAIIGNGAINLSEDVDIRAGFFALGYTDNDLIKAVIFRLEDQDASFVGEQDLDQLCQRFPLNSRCRYWPLTSS
jgi:hypothetical protein